MIQTELAEADCRRESGGVKDRADRLVRPQAGGDNNAVAARLVAALIRYMATR